VSKKLRLGIVGLGRVAKSHLAAIKELSDMIELVAIVSRDRLKGEKEAENWPHAEVFTSYERALSDSSAEAFLLLLPHHLHSAYSIQALEAGKHVLIEKPMAMNYAEAKQMVETAERHHVKLMVGQSRRFFQPVMSSIDHIRSMEIGNVINMNVLFLGHMNKPAVDWWKDNEQIGGFIIPLWGSHILDYIIWVYQELPESVYAQGLSNNPNWDGEDEVAISLRFAGGRMANVMMSFNAGSRPTDEEGLTGKRIWSTQNSIYDRYIIGENGMMHLRDEYELFVNGELASSSLGDTSNFTRQLNEFYCAIIEQRAPLAAGQEILGVMKLIDACYASMKSNRIISL
jgi:predicted dehydrogenase